MRVLIACEESQTVCKAFRKRGHEAYSCDILPTSGNHPEWHIQDDVLKHLNDGWDMMIAFPPCTYLSSVQTFLCRKNPQRVLKRIEAAKFFMTLYNSNIPKVAIENPTGVMSHIFRLADQIIHPWYFGDVHFKRTGLWLIDLPLLQHIKGNNLFDNNTYNEPLPFVKKWTQKSTGKIKYQRTVSKPFLSSVERSKLSPFIAEAMAEQWNFQ